MSGLDLSPSGARAALGGLRAGGDDAALVDALSRVVWSVLTEPGDGVAGRVIAEFGALGALQRVIGGGSIAAAGIDASEVLRALARWTPRLDSRAVRRAIEAARRGAAHLLVPGDARWPTRVDDLGVFAPVVLWARGDPSIVADSSPSVAIVGARAATPYGEHVAGELAAELASTGATVVSGAAYGIDGVAHRSALHVGGRTAALLAGGVDRPYPSGHTALIESVATSGVALAETPCGTPPTKWRFLSRNRLIAALADVAVVVEAGVRSGSLNTAAHAAALGRALGAVPGPVTNAASAGCHRVIREFDGTLVTGAADVLELLGLDSAATRPVDDTRTDEFSRMLDALSTRQSRGIGEIARRSGLAHEDVQGLVALAGVSGQVEERPDGWRRTPSNR